MTTFTSAGNGDWRTPATWDVGSGYPDGLDDKAIIDGHAVVIPSLTEDDIAGEVDVINSGSLQVSSGSSLELGNSVSPALYVDGTSTFILYGRLKGQETGELSRVHLVAGATCTYPGVNHTLRRIQWLTQLTQDISDIFGATSEADQLTCHPYPYLGGVVTIDESIVCKHINAEHGTIIFDAGVTVRFAANGQLIAITGGIVQVNGTVSNPVSLEAYTAGTTWRMRLGGHASNVLDWLEISDLAGAELWDPGGTYGFAFAKQPQEADPLQNPPILDIDDPYGRDHSRVHAKGNSAGIVEITGNYRYSDGDHKRVDAMMKARSLVGFVSSEMQVPAAYIILNDYKFKKGHLTTPYTIALQEAR